MYININTNTYPYSLSKLKQDNAEVSFPDWSKLDSETKAQRLSSFGVYEVTPVEIPSYNKETQQIQEGVPELVNAKWQQSWVISELPAETILANQTAATQDVIRQFDEALTLHLDAVAQSKRYDNRISCAVRAGFAGPFQAEGVAFAQWMDACNATAYQILFDVQQGIRSVPASPEAFIAELPVITWP